MFRWLICSPSIYFQAHTERPPNARRRNPYEESEPRKKARAYRRALRPFAAGGIALISRPQPIPTVRTHDPTSVWHQNTRSVVFSFSIVIVLLCASAGFAHYQAHQIQSHLLDIKDTWMASVETISDLRRNFDGAQRATLGVVLSDN